MYYKTPRSRMSHFLFVYDFSLVFQIWTFCLQSRYPEVSWSCCTAPWGTVTGAASPCLRLSTPSSFPWERRQWQGCTRGGQLWVLWLTAAPPSVCRLLTYWVDKHSRASGVVPAWHCSCLHIAHGAAKGVESPASPAALAPCHTRRLQDSGNVTIELQNWNAFPQVGIYPPPN